MPEPTIKGARPATPLEVAEWERFKQYYNTVLAPAVLKSKTVSEIANQAQAVIDANKVPGFVYDQGSLSRTMNLLNRFNMIGRYIAGVESGKYAIRLKDGDIDILASPEMTKADYEADIYPAPGLGVHPLIWVLGVGAVLVAGLFGVSSIIDSDAKKEAETNKGRLLDADKEMLKAPEPIKKAWIDFKRAMVPTAQKVGVLGEFFGTEAAGKIGAGIGAGLLLLAAAFALSKWRRG